MTGVLFVGVVLVGLLVRRRRSRRRRESELAGLSAVKPQFVTAPPLRRMHGIERETLR